MRYQRHQTRALPYRNNIRSNLRPDSPARKDRIGENLLGKKSGFGDMSADTINSTSDPIYHQVGGYGDPFEGSSDGNKARPYQSTGNEGRTIKC